VWSSNLKGAIAETAIVHAATRLGIGVYRPVTEGGRCDLIFDTVSGLLRVQCKWAARSGGVIAVRCYSSRRVPDGFLKRGYTAGEVDAIIAYCEELDRCYVLPLPLFSGRSAVQLRLERARNNQCQGVHWAADYELQSLDWSRI
jgi:hypothetical protein